MTEIYPFPAGEPQSTLYRVLADDNEVKCYSARCSAVPFNQMWPGYQRPHEQTEQTAFCSFGADRAVSISVWPAFDFKSAVIRPLSKNITPKLFKDRVEFSAAPGQYTLELDGMHRALHIFINPVGSGLLCGACAEGLNFFGTCTTGEGTAENGFKKCTDKTREIAGSLNCERAAGPDIAAKDAADPADSNLCGPCGGIDGSCSNNLCASNAGDYYSLSGSSCSPHNSGLCGPSDSNLNGHNQSADADSRTNTEKTAKMGRTIHFGPGVHRPGPIQLFSGDRLLIDGGAVVHTSVEICGDDVLIAGFGIIDNSGFERGGPPLSLKNINKSTYTASFCIKAENRRNITIAGVTIRDARMFALAFYGCRNVVADNIKLIGMWRYNSDGIDFCNSSMCTVKNSFLRNFDDCIVIKGIKGFDSMPVSDILADNCVIWCDWGRALEIGAETCADSIKNIVFKNCDIIHSCHVAMDIQHGDRAQIENVSFLNINAEIFSTLPPAYQNRPEEVYKRPADDYRSLIFVVETMHGMWSQDDKNGSVKKVRFENICVLCDGDPQSLISSRADGSSIEDIVFKNVLINRKKVLAAEDAGITVTGNVKNLNFLP